MATKNIGRSALEGGRHRRNKWERNNSHRHERARARTWLDRVKQDIEFAEESVPRARDGVYKGFTDKLSPCYRWLDSKVGQRWDAVYAELSSAFDTRRLSSWHIVHQHMLPEVEGSGSSYPFFSFGRNETYFHIDDDGILRGQYRRKRHWEGPKGKLVGPSAASVNRWLNGRKPIDYGVSQFWGEVTQWGWVECQTGWGGRSICKSPELTHRKIDITPAWKIEKYSETKHRSWQRDQWWRKWRHEHFTGIRWRQGKRFTKEEALWWSKVGSLIKELAAKNI